MVTRLAEKRYWQRSLTTGAITALLASLVFAPPASAVEEGACTPVVVIGLRGSGEGAAHGDTGWWGPTLDKLFTNANQWGALRNAPRLEVGAPDYPAVPIDWELLNPLVETTLIESAQAGADAAVKAYDEFAASVPNGCNAPKLILVGYSQGAIAARMVATQMYKRDPTRSSTGPVSAVHLVGDPWQKPNGDGVFGSGSDGNGIIRPLNDPQDDYYELPGIRRVSICHDSDLVCDSPFSGTGPHLTYFDPGVKFVSNAGASASDTDEVDFMRKSLATSINRARLDYGMGPTVTPVKASYRGGDTVTARYTATSPFAADTKYYSGEMYSNLSQCGVGMSAVDRGGRSSADVMDVLQLTVAGTQVRDVTDLINGVSVPAGQTSFDVTITVDNDRLAQAATDTFTGTNADVLGVEEFDTNRNGRIDGAEAYPAYAHVLTGYCGDGSSGRWNPATGWHAFLRTGDETTASWLDGPPLQFQMLAGDAPAPPPPRTESPFGS